MDRSDAIKGCLFGGAVGDALGYPVEFLSAESIFRFYGERGITEYAPDRDVQISDDTQMTLFTAVGLLYASANGADVLTCIHRAYRDWFRTQTSRYAPDAEKGVSWLLNVPGLYRQRAPGNTCLHALSQSEAGTIARPLNNSKGCGGIMRVAPIGVYFCGTEIPIDRSDMLAAESAAITHGHELGYLPAAMFAHILRRIVESGASVRDAVTDAIFAMPALFPESLHLRSLLALVRRALALAGENRDELECIEELGEGWVAEETLAIAVFCAVRFADDFERGVIAAVNHGGDSDSTGAVTGNLLGAALGAVPPRFLAGLELKEVIGEVASDLCGRPADEVWRKKYVDRTFTVG